jgi:hypothetical protein
LRDLELLVNTAQIAVGLAGFTGVASVLGRRGDAAHDRAQAERLRGMIETALLVAAASLLPIVVERAGVAEPLAWRISAGVFLAVAVPGSLRGIGRAVRVNRAVGQTPGWMLIWRSFTLGIVAVVAVSLSASMLGLVPGPAGFIVAVYALLIFSGILFFRFFLGASAVPRE